MSFSCTALQRMQRLAPGVPLVMLIEKAHHWPMLRRVIGEDWIVGPGIDAAPRPPAASPQAPRQDAAATSTCGRSTPPRTSSSASSSGVKAVITDRPAYMLELLDA